MVTNAEANERREPSCTLVLWDKKYFDLGSMFMKRTLRRHEWLTPNDGSSLMIPPANLGQKYKTEAAAVDYIRKNTDIPVPPISYAFEDDGAVSFMSQVVEGVALDLLDDKDKPIVIKELEQIVETLRTLKSDVPGVPGQTLLCPPWRVCNMEWKPDSCWRPKPETKGEFVFCHNDLGQQNVLVDPKTLKITAIIDWEFAGFYPPWFEGAFWKREGPSCALEGEEDDVQKCRDWLMTYCDEVEMPFPGTWPMVDQDKHDHFRRNPSRANQFAYHASVKKGDEISDEDESATEDGTTESNVKPVGDNDDGYLCWAYRKARNFLFRY
ncbi:hypothetical protein E4U43_008663 [Claviceps pusilla]|uniref:Aminoglycoside phosphotransferase domain-containing protein n=1 Tax=Claviceps pusilla TaxID=123648 RepID=A0A9P7NCS4_9HYPO|nr:hypothetical protein E4U43_008663 [Claviceps pusilla]